MTMPHLSNCPHSPDGWCLDCVKAQGESLIRTSSRLEKLLNAVLCGQIEPATILDNRRLYFVSDDYRRLDMAIAEAKKGNAP